MDISPTVPLDSVISIKIFDGSDYISGSGVLISGGAYILTAAHLFNNYIYRQSIDIISADGTQMDDAQVYIHHSWDKMGSDFNHDIAMIRLSSPVASSGLSLWRGGSHETTPFLLTGFGNAGALHTGTNIFDGDASLLNPLFDKSVIENSQVFYDYDNGLFVQNSSNNLFNIESTHIATANETIGKFGDSGGGLLVDNQVAAISSYIFRDSRYDINDVVDSSYGEVGVATNVTSYIPWIEYITSGNPNYSIPDEANNVLTTVSEPFAGSVINYFLLQMLVASEETVSLRFTTRDGTATAGEDYSYTEGWVTLLPYETQAAIGVRIYGDTLLESNETFSLVVNDPSGQWLDTDTELIASHTIINNDIFIL